MTARSLVLLTRTATPGLGKTRLRRTLPGASVDALTAAFLRDTVEWCGGVDARLVIAHSGPAGDLPVADAILVPQADGGLGTRIDAAIAETFARGADEVVLIGSDSPDLPDRLIGECFAHLSDAETTLVPATDGGWVALGTRRPLDGCLSGVRWGVRSTCIDTVAALGAAGRVPHILDAWYDVDDIASLRRLRRRLALDPARAPRSAQLVAALLS